MSLTVLSVGYPLAAVGPDAVGGAEQILSRIDRALTIHGHRSLVVACAGSQTFGQLIPTHSLPDHLTGEFHEKARANTLDTIYRALNEYPVDVIHLHGLDFPHYLPVTDVPVIATLHLPPSWYPDEIFYRENLMMHCVSAAQRKSCPAGAKLLPDIPNGVPIPIVSTGEREGFALSLGRVCPEKGFHLAADAARLAGVPFVLAGEVFRYEAHQSYFCKEILPRLNGAARFIGPARTDQKRDLLARARCVLIPSLVAETSSLVAMEAMAAGTPVIAFRAGALVDSVRNGLTGFLVNSVEEMAEAIARVGEISSAVCRQYARENFSVDRMTSSYLDLYHRTVATQKNRSSLLAS